MCAFNVVVYAVTLTILNKAPYVTHQKENGFVWLKCRTDVRARDKYIGWYITNSAGYENVRPISLTHNGGMMNDITTNQWLKYIYCKNQFAKMRSLSCFTGFGVVDDPNECSQYTFFYPLNNELNESAFVTGDERHGAVMGMAPWILSNMASVSQVRIRDHVIVSFPSSVEYRHCYDGLLCPSLETIEDIYVQFIILLSAFESVAIRRTQLNRNGNFAMMCPTDGVILYMTKEGACTHKMRVRRPTPFYEPENYVVPFYACFSSPRYRPIEVVVFVPKGRVEDRHFALMKKIGTTMPMYFGGDKIYTLNELLRNKMSCPCRHVADVCRKPGALYISSVIALPIKRLRAGGTIVCTILTRDANGSYVNDERFENASLATTYTLEHLSCANTSRYGKENRTYELPPRLRIKQRTKNKLALTCDWLPPCDRTSYIRFRFHGDRDGRVVGTVELREGRLRWTQDSELTEDDKTLVKLGYHDDVHTTLILYRNNSMLTFGDEHNVTAVSCGTTIFSPQTLLSPRRSPDIEATPELQLFRSEHGTVFCAYKSRVQDKLATWSSLDLSVINAQRRDMYRNYCPIVEHSNYNPGCEYTTQGVSVHTPLINATNIRYVCSLQAKNLHTSKLLTLIPPAPCSPIDIRRSPQTALRLSTVVSNAKSLTITVSCSLFSVGQDAKFTPPHLCRFTSNDTSVGVYLADDLEQPIREHRLVSYDTSSRCSIERSDVIQSCTEYGFGKFGVILASNFTLTPFYAGRMVCVFQRKADQLIGNTVTLNADLERAMLQNINKHRAHWSEMNDDIDYSTWPTTASNSTQTANEMPIWIIGLIAASIFLILLIMILTVHRFCCHHRRGNRRRMYSYRGAYPPGRLDMCAVCELEHQPK